MGRQKENAMRRSKRTSRPCTPLAVLGACLALAANAPRAAAQADDPVPGTGALRVAGPDGRPAGACPLERTDVRVEIAGFVARVRVVQVFRNPRAEAVEAIYTFPLSDRGAVDALWMPSGGRT